MPESTIAFRYDQKFFHLSEAISLLDANFNNNYVKYLPPINKEDNLVSNAFLTQFIANYFDADVIIGMDNDNYNAAMVFHPQNGPVESYEKKILVPIGEYIPFDWLKNIAGKFGITGSYHHGHGNNKIFNGKIVPFAISICYEETFGNLIRKNSLGAKLLVNISNDAWFPKSRLPQQHFDHGKIRSVENGSPLIRACNTGITGAVDAFGNIIKIFGQEEKKGGVLLADIPLNHYLTPYSIWGDFFILILSCSIIIIYLLKQIKPFPQSLSFIFRKKRKNYGDNKGSNHGRR
jgi:apolipoprotein N-acyltransferase